MKTKKNRPLYLRVVSTKMLYLSAGCAEYLNQRIDLYECGNIMAMVSHPMSKYHLSRKSDLCRGLNLCSIELVSYLGKRYGIKVNERLDAWANPGESEQVIFFSNRITEKMMRVPFDERFHKVELGYQKRYGEWMFVEDKCISFNRQLREILPPYTSLYRCGEVLALMKDREGPYRAEYRGERKGTAIYSTRLAEYIRKEFRDNGRSVLLYAKAKGTDIYFSMKEELLNQEYLNRKFFKVDLGVERDKFLSIQSRSIYLSSRAAQILGSRFSLLQGENWLAFQRDAGGEYGITTVGYQNTVSNRKLKALVTTCYPGEKRLYLQEYGMLWVVTAQPGEIEGVPAPEQFQKICSADSASVGHYIRSQKDQALFETAISC